jgi:carbamoyltransferase
MSYVLGISCYYHDSSAAIINNGEIVSAAQEERFTRIKHDPSFPTNSINFNLKFNNIKLSDIEAVVFYEKPFLKFERILETYVKFAPRGFVSFAKSAPVWIKEKLFQKLNIINELKKIDKSFDENKIFFSEHHLSHAASAFYPSPFDKAIIITLDGVGEFATTSVSIGDGNNIIRKKEIQFPDSLGLLYSAFTYFLGFKVNSGEYKVMGLAPYGKPIYSNLIKEKIIDIKSDGSFRLNMSFFDFATGLKMINRRFEKLFKIKRRNTEVEELKQVHMDIASSVQAVITEICLKIFIWAKEKYKIENLCLAGGVALNCVMNGAILKNKIFENIWIQPASGDAGGSLGAALAFWYLDKKKTRKIDKEDSMKGSYLGPSFSKQEIKKNLDELQAVYQEKDRKELFPLIAREIADGKAVGCFSGRMEFGPRALGARSIIADPRNFEMQKKLNLKIKFRESFRPFAPAILEEKIHEWYETKVKSPYMLLVSEVQDKHKLKISELDKNKSGIDLLKIKRSVISAVTHVDYSSRLQTVNKKTNPFFYELINHFNELTGCPILINTSFNIRGEPIVNNVTDAFNCFMGTNIDILIIEDFILFKEKQIKNFDNSYKKKYKLD